MTKISQIKKSLARKLWQGFFVSCWKIAPIAAASFFLLSRESLGKEKRYSGKRDKASKILKFICEIPTESHIEAT